MEATHTPPDGALTGYRVLDLCDTKGVLCTKIMAYLGADVIIIKPPEGNTIRSLRSILSCSSGEAQIARYNDDKVFC